MPEFILGVINLRGKMLPVMDLRRRLGCMDNKKTESTCIIIAKLKSSSAETFEMGFIVDAAQEVVFISRNDLDDAPGFNSDVDSKAMLAVATIKGVPKTLLDIETLVEPQVKQLFNPEQAAKS